MATLAEIREKVRTLSRRKSPTQMSDDTIDNYINTFVLYDMPYRDQVFHLKRTFKFLTSPYVGEYSTTDSVYDTMNNFKNIVTSVTEPVYIHGRPVFFSQDRLEFFSLYPQNKVLVSIGTGDGVTTIFSGTLGNVPIIQKSMVVSATYIDLGNVTKMGFYDRPEELNGLIRTYGLFVTDDESPTGYGLIDYITGDYTISFPFAPTSGTDISIAFQQYAASLPIAMLFYGDTFIIRPIPDKVYDVVINATIRPTELLLDLQRPDIDQWWQYIAIGAARKIFQDDLDNDSAALLEQQFQEQETLCSRKFTLQLSKQRSSTIYVDPIYNRRWPFGNRNYY